MIGVKFYLRQRKDDNKFVLQSYGDLVKMDKEVDLTGLKDEFVQNQPSVICLGRWVSIYYPAIDEWFDIVGPPPTTEALTMGYMRVDPMPLQQYLKVTGKEGFKRALNCLWGRYIFKRYKPPVEEKEDRTYSNTDDFFSEGPGGHEDLIPPIVIGGMITGEQDG